MNSLIKFLINDDVYEFEKSRHLLNELDSSSMSSLPNIFDNHPNPIAYTAFYGATDCFLFLVKQGIKVQIIDDESRSAIHFACAGNYKMVRMLIEDFDQFNCIDSLGRTALHYSVEYNQQKISQLLVEDYKSKQMSLFEANNFQASMLINTKDIFGVTPFHLSIEQENNELVDYFIENGANVNQSDNDGCAPIHIAAKVGSILLISKLINNGAKLHKKSKNGRTIYHFAAFSSMPSIFKDLLSLCENHIGKYYNINTPDRFGRIPLHYACEQGSIPIVHELLKLHSDVSRRDIDMMMPIHFAALNGNASIIQLLINYGSPAYVKDENLRTPLHLACESGSYNAVRFLCKKYKKLIKEETKYGSSPLHSLAENEVSSDNAQIAQFLISKGSDINKKNKFGQTPLHCATQNGLYNTIGILIDSGANLNIADNSLRNPLDIAFNLNNEEAKEILIENGACFSPKRSAASSRLSSASQSPCSSPKIVRKSVKVSIDQNDFKLESFE